MILDVNVAADQIRLLSDARRALAAAIDGYWIQVLDYEAAVGLPNQEARDALGHSALALRALERTTGGAA